VQTLSEIAQSFTDSMNREKEFDKYSEVINMGMNASGIPPQAPLDMRKAESIRDPRSDQVNVNVNSSGDANGSGDGNGVTLEESSPRGDEAVQGMFPMNREKADHFFSVMRRCFGAEYNLVILVFVDTLQVGGYYLDDTMCCVYAGMATTQFFLNYQRASTLIVSISDLPIFICCLYSILFHSYRLSVCLSASSGRRWTTWP
jgi:hypothetical protein